MELLTVNKDSHFIIFYKIYFSVWVCYIPEKSETTVSKSSVSRSALFMKELRGE